MKSIHGHRSGGKRSKEYVAWDKMMTRCYNKKSPNYKRYGGKGITVCERWKVFENFLADVGLAPSPLHSLDRFPNNKGNYEPTNFRWATFEEQQRNRTDNKLVEAFGQTKTMSEWCAISGLAKSTVYGRIADGWDIEDAITTPAKKYRTTEAK